MKNAIIVSGLILIAVSRSPSWGISLDDAWVQAQKMSSSARITSAAYKLGEAPSADMPTVPVEWVSIGGGKFTVGPSRRVPRKTRVSIKTFEMSKTLVTVEQYAECVSKGACTEPRMSKNCNWGETGRQRYPMNCVDWDHANLYAKFKGARLPSESEYEYAATNGGQNQKYPWGNDEPTADKAVYGVDRTQPVCSKPAGNTAQGLCDMAGNVEEWMQDKFHAGAPADGSAFEGATDSFQVNRAFRATRGGSYYLTEPIYLQADFGCMEAPGVSQDSIGFRLAR